MRGEQQKINTLNLARAGSPPHARGAAEEYINATAPQGITPACAGSSVLPIQIPPITQDHPRMRGEQARRPLAVGCYSGITPACAGSSF